MITRAFLLVACAALLAGCYTLGDARPRVMEGITTISVPVSRNNTLEPNVEALLADTIVKKIQTDGTYSIARGDGADAVLNTTLTSVNRAPARSVQGNVLATSEFLLFTTVSFELLEQAGGRTVMSGQVTGQTSFFVTGDLQTDESQALPLAFSDAAVKLTSRLSEGF
ncbi:MAG: LPS assembly lipoprotein LptE [Chthoniobacterales bacterium]